MLVCSHFIGAASETQVTVQFKYVWSMYVIPCRMYVFIIAKKYHGQGIYLE